MIIRDSYDSNVTFISSDPSPYAGNDEWRISKLSPGDSYSIEIEVQVHMPLENIVLNNTANVTCSQGIKNETYEETQVVSAPELVITKDAIDMNGSPLRPGDEVHYIINITNIGDKNHHDNPGNELNDSIPLHTIYETNSVKSDRGTASYNSGNNMITWNGELNVSETVTIEFNVTVAFPLDNNTTIINDAVLNWDSNGDNVNNEVSHAYANLTVISSPALSIQKTDSSDPIQASSELTYYLWVNNTGDANATNVVVTESYDANTQFLYANPSPSSGNNVWTFSKISTGDGRTIEIHVHIVPVENGTILLNTANVTCDEGSSNETNETTEVWSLPSLQIEKVSIPGVAEAGGSIEYRIWVNNTGTAPATNVTVRETYDSHISFNHSYPASDGAGHDIWVFPVLEVGMPVMITIFVDISPSFEGDVLHNFVNVTCDEGMYAQAWANTTVVHSPPVTVKKFHGYVYNVTFFEGDYLLHYITNETTITLYARDMPEGGGSGINHTYYRIFKWNYSSSKWDILFNWEEYGVWSAYRPFDPIDLAELGTEYGYPPCGKYEIEFYSVDKEGNTEGMEWNDVFVDCGIPQSHVVSLPYEIHEDKFNVKAVGSDDGGIKEITLYYRYSADNHTWDGWNEYGGESDGYSWTFVPPEGTGYYQFYSVATDYAGHTETLPNETTAPDAICRVIQSPWDVNGDGSVNIFDVVIVAQHWMENAGSPNWCECADVNGDGEVNMDDMAEIAARWTG